MTILTQIFFWWKYTLDQYRGLIRPKSAFKKQYTILTVTKKKHPTIYAKMTILTQIFIQWKYTLDQFNTEGLFKLKIQFYSSYTLSVFPQTHICGKNVIFPLNFKLPQKWCIVRHSKSTNKSKNIFCLIPYKKSCSGGHLKVKVGSQQAQDNKYFLAVHRSPNKFKLYFMYAGDFQNLSI